MIISCLVASAFGFGMINEYGMIPQKLQLDLDGNSVFYRNMHADGDDYSLESDSRESQWNLMPAVRFQIVNGLELSLMYPIRDDGLKNSTGFWGPVFGIKYGSVNSVGFFDIVFPSGAKDLLGNGEELEPALVFGGTSFYGGAGSAFGVRIHSWYFWDFNEYSADKLYFLIRPEYDLGNVRIGLGFPMEFCFGNDGDWIDNTPGHVRGAGETEDGEIGYAGAISIEPKLTFHLNALEIEPSFSIPLWKFSGKNAVLLYGFTMGVSTRLNLF
jgi:hypothetical protein